VDQPFDNHNGGMIAFGPDGFLYIGLGDGGGSGDPQGNAQDLTTLLGKILRIDVSTGTPYSIPADNPFVGVAGARREIWALGLRNPWRFSFDRDSADLYIGDVGEADWEEIDFQSALVGGGANYGWNITEGPDCFNAAACIRTGLTDPVLSYRTATGCAVVGGYVYRGAALSALQGHYLYSDNCAGFIKSFRVVLGQVTDERTRTNTFDPGSGVTSFGEDGLGELYVMTQGGRLLKFVPGS
jgi:glucose/arabinose dehydrogenase